MVIDKNYFLNRLANGEDMDVIGQEMAAMMNAALTEHTARIEAEKALAAEADRENAKRELIEELIEIVQELAILEGMDEDDLTMTDEDVDQLVAAFSEMFNVMREMKKLAAALNDKPKSRVTSVKSDEDILAEFVKMFS